MQSCWTYACEQIAVVKAGLDTLLFSLYSRCAWEFGLSLSLTNEDQNHALSARREGKSVVQEGCAVHFKRYSRWIWAEDIYEVLDCRMGLSENVDLDFKYFDTSNKIRYRIPYHCSFFSCSGC